MASSNIDVDICNTISYNSIYEQKYNVHKQTWLLLVKLLIKLKNLNFSTQYMLLFKNCYRVSGTAVGVCSTPYMEQFG